MAISQDRIITVGTGATAKTFGISKSLDNYTIDDLLGIGDWAYSAFNDSEMNANVYSDINTSGTMIDIADGQYASRVVCYPDNQLMSKGYNTNSEGVFCRNVLIYYDVAETNWVSSSVNVDAGRFPHYYVVTDIDLQDLIINALSDPNAVASSYTTLKLGVNDVTIAPFQLYLDQNGELSLNMLLPPVGGRSSSINPNSDLVCYSTAYGNWSVYTASGGGGRNIKDQMPFHFFGPNHVDYPFQNSRIPGTQVLTDDDKLIQCVKTDAPDTPARFHFRYKVELMDKPYIDSARCGIRFKINDTLYKPIVENGMITGYTDDDTVQSEWDTWETIKDHVTPSEPPEPVPAGDEDNTDAISTVGAPFGTGLAHYYVTTVDSVTLQHISEAMSTWDIDTSKKDLYKNLISCKLIKPPAGIPSTSGVFTIYGVKPQYNGADITIPEVTGNPSITFGPYSIDRKFNDFRDYAPYSKAEIFVPYCGWTALPSHVIGRSVYVDYFTDVIAGTVKAVIRCGNNVVAEAAGVMAVDIPFAAQNVGAKVAAATTGMLSYGQGALQASVGIGQAVASKGRSGIKNITSGLASVIGAYNQMAMVNNENWTEINGKSGDGCALAGIDTIIIKITRPKYGSYTAPYYVPADYGHTVGFVSMKKTTVGSCTGLIICDNVDTSGISDATDRERQLIKEYLESGVIVKHPE